MLSVDNKVELVAKIGGREKKKKKKRKKERKSRCSTKIRYRSPFRLATTVTVNDASRGRTCKRHINSIWGWGTTPRAQGSIIALKFTRKSPRFNDNEVRWQIEKRGNKTWEKKKKKNNNNK
ncbi:hypothetical protein POVWA1_035460 [Plasmodium ovale wallikeri]|uniref:Uncharacterized protein n=1 Tax=Plasmodium ovale wallikeri TaxID=864142 RepID=A0A1A8Z0E7_PLAOA|nr:hypothetical protein POVWA1_035460 [Plasmodium ovale wallikeri]